MVPSQSPGAMPSQSPIRAVLGVGAIVVAIFIMLPVSVNLPDSWPGALIAFVLAGIGVILIVMHFAANRRARSPSDADNA
jgi:peptidoglycan/LPS O-acetylase OafA/YrhL